eukprot:157511-Ditylum_brightwellii.AAC.1
MVDSGQELHSRPHMVSRGCECLCPNVPSDGVNPSTEGTEDTRRMKFMHILSSNERKLVRHQVFAITLTQEHYVTHSKSKRLYAGLRSSRCQVGMIQSLDWKYVAISHT